MRKNWGVVTLNDCLTETNVNQILLETSKKVKANLCHAWLLYNVITVPLDPQHSVTHNIPKNHELIKCYL